MTKVFVGIDLAFAKEKLLPVCICRREAGRLVPIPIATSRSLLPPRGKGNAAAINALVVKAFANEVVAYLTAIERSFSIKIARIAIDAPCIPRSGNLSRRLCEAALSCSCFTTPTEFEFKEKLLRASLHLKEGRPESTLPAANQLWMLVGFELFKTLRNSWECIEVYPQATVVELSAAAVHKSKMAGITAQIKALQPYTRWPASTREVNSTLLKGYVWGSAHDRLDAYSSAWIASLDEGQRKALGNPPDDAIWIPDTANLIALTK